MADKANFTPDEWELLQESVMMAGMAVTAADPNGLWGLLKEVFATNEELVKVRMDSGANPLIRAVVSNIGNEEGWSATRDAVKAKLRGLTEIPAKCIETLRQAGALVDAKAPADAAAFKGWLRQISQHVAEAAPEIGGALVSDKEKATLKEISDALKLAA